MGHEFVIERSVAASPDQVWAVLTDLHRAEQHLSAVEHVEVLTDGPYAVGTRWRETRRMMGRRETQEMVVTEVEEPRRTVVAAEQGGVTYTTTFTLEPHGVEALLTMWFSADASQGRRGTKIAAALFGALGGRVARKAMQAELDDIARAAEESTPR